MYRSSPKLGQGVSVFDLQIFNQRERPNTVSSVRSFQGSKPRTAARAPVLVWVLILSGLAQACTARNFELKVVPLSAPGIAQGANPGDEPPVSGALKTETFTQPEAPQAGKVDVLFIADTSGSMSDDLGAVASEVGSFANGLSNAIDFRIAVALAHAPSSQYSGKFYSASGVPKVLDSKVMSREDMRAGLVSTMLSAPSTNSSGEFLFKQIMTLLEPSKLAARQSEGFFRPDAALVVALISDEADICDPLSYLGQTSDEYALRFSNCGSGITHQQVASAVASAKGSQPVVFVSIANSDPQGIYSGSANYGFGLVNLASGAGNLLIDIRTQSFSQGLLAAGQLTAEVISLVREYHLSSPVMDPASITVRVDGLRVGFRFDAGSNTVVLDQPGNYGSSVSIQYLTEVEVD